MTNELTTRARELFQEVDEYNWDDGVVRMQEILNDPACDRATAVMMFWRTEPLFYLGKAAKGETFYDYEQPTYDLIQAIIKKIQDGAVPVGPNSYTPTEDWQIDREHPLVRSLPPAMIEAIKGVEGE